MTRNEVLRVNGLMYLENESEIVRQDPDRGN